MRGSQITQEQRDEMARLYQQGHTTNEIAAMTGTHPNTVRNQLNRWRDGLPQPENRSAKAREMLRDGATTAEVMGACDVSISTVKRIREQLREEAARRPTGEPLAIAIWRLHMRGVPPSRIDERLGTHSARDAIVFEWQQDKLRQPSLVTGGPK